MQPQMVIWKRFIRNLLCVTGGVGVCKRRGTQFEGGAPEGDS